MTYTKFRKKISSEFPEHISTMHNDKIVIRSKKTDETLMAVRTDVVYAIEVEDYTFYDVC